MCTVSLVQVAEELEELADALNQEHLASVASVARQLRVNSFLVNEFFAGDS